ncbi:MAG TPA: 5-formyltetrahydrofolate cyclo-ligase [Holophaga sp.]|nr:5-formyltetrahydrofolate cyclo-ligase [Holophaga sp.]
MPEPADKAALRRNYMALREAAAPEDRARWSAAVCGHLRAFMASRGLRSVAAFCPFGAEVDLRALWEGDPGAAWCFPRVARRTPPTLEWGPLPLEPGTWGLMEPARTPWTAPPAELILVPGLAFAADGHRLGYGKGFYDGVLRDLRPGIVTLGVGFALQRCRELPTWEGDVPVQGLVDEGGITWIPAPGPRENS